ncbi:MAG: DUF3566 domain-containing protein [Candidatus Neomarinimicrobiota bacterium]
MKRIDLWSVARTVFPLGWIVAFIVIFVSYLLVGSLVINLASEFTDVPIIDRGTGVFAGFLLSLLLGFFSTVALTLIAVVAAVIYNFLAALGGGISVKLSEPVAMSESSGGETDKSQGKESE